jgi:hypothetical protein
MYLGPRDHRGSDRSVYAHIVSDRTGNNASSWLAYGSCGMRIVPPAFMMVNAHGATSTLQSDRLVSDAR